MSGILETLLEEIRACRRQVATLHERVDNLINNPVDKRIGGIALAREILRQHADTIREGCREGRIPHTMRNKRFHFKAQELIAYRDSSDTTTIQQEVEHMRGGHKRMHQHPASHVKRA